MSLLNRIRYRIVTLTCLDMRIADGKCLQIVEKVRIIRWLIFDVLFYFSMIGCAQYPSIWRLVNDSLLPQLSSIIFTMLFAFKTLVILRQQTWLSFRNVRN